MKDLILKRDNNSDIAYTFEKGSRNLCVLYLHGWNSNRKKEKALAIQEVAKSTNCSYLSLDYTAHGESEGQPADFTIGQAIQDAMDVIQYTVQTTPLVVVGNSIGGWIGLWLSEHLKQVAGFIGLAPAPDITKLVWDKLMPEYAKLELEKGNILGPSPDTQGFCFTKQLFEDGERHFLLNRSIDFDAPVRLIIGDKDERVEFDRILKIKDNLTSNDVTISLIKGADHHLSSPSDLKKIKNITETLIRDL